MAREKKSQFSDETPDPAAQERSRDRASPPPTTEEEPEETPLARAEATMTLVSAWVSNLQTLVQMELSRTISASKRIIALQLLLLPLGLALVLSICGGAGLVGYYYSQSIYVGFAVFVLVQIAILAGILMYQKSLRSMIGFDESKRQAKEALHDVFETFK